MNQDRHRLFCRLHNVQFRGFRGFTLLEVLIALGLSGALLASAFSFYFNLMNTRTRLIERADEQRAADVIIERIEADLTTCIVGDGQIGAGVKGNSTSLTIAHRGVSASLADRGVDDPAVFGDLQISQFQFNANQQTISIQQRSGRESSFGASHDLTSRIAKLRFRYFDGSQWRDTFDSLSAGTLPIAVEVAIWFDHADEEDALSAEASDDEPLDEFAGGFDEFAYAMRDDRGFEREPLPDRSRVIVVPDAANDDTSAEVAP